MKFTIFPLAYGAHPKTRLSLETQENKTLLQA